MWLSSVNKLNFASRCPLPSQVKSIVCQWPISTIERPRAVRSEIFRQISIEFTFKTLNTYLKYKELKTQIASDYIFRIYKFKTLSKKELN